MSVKPDHSNERQHRREMAGAINRLFQGKVDTVGTVTLTSASATTVVSNSNAGGDSVPVLVALNTAAAGELAAGTIFISSRDDGSFTITHANNTTTRNYAFVLLG